MESRAGRFGIQHLRITRFAKLEPVEGGIKDTAWTNSNPGKKIQWAFRVKALK